MGEFYSKRYFYKGGIGMTQSLKRFASAVLALVMAMTCLVFTNVASVSAAEPATFGTYTIGTSATGDLAVTTKSATVGNVTFNLRGINADNGTVRKGLNEITFTTTKSFTINAKFTESSSRNVVITDGTDTVVLKSGETSATLPAGDYTLTNDDEKNNSQISSFILAEASGEESSSATTTTETTTTTEATTTETTTKATTTTETTTEETTMGVLKVKVNNPASSSDTTVNVTVKKNGTTISNVTALNIGSETEIAGVNEDDVITFTFAKEQAKQITNWNSNLKSVFRDKTYTLTYTVGKTIAIPEMDYYSSMPAAVSLGQTETKAAGYGTYGFGQYKVQTNGNDLAKCAIIKGHQYSLFDVGSGDYDKDGTKFGIPDERILLLGGTDDEIELTNSIDSSEKVLVLLDCSGDNAIVTATGGNLYSSYDGSTGTTAAQITGISKNGVKVQFYVDGGTTITIKGTGTSANAYTVVKSIRLFNLNNIVDGDKMIDNGAVSTMTEDSPFYNVVTSNSLATTDKLFTLIGNVTGNHKDKDFLNQIDKVGFVILNADTVDANDPNGQYTPMQLKYNNPDVNFGGVYVETTDIYKNVYDATNYNSSLDSSEGYTGYVDSTLETNNNVAYFAELVSVSAGHRYYAYPYTLYAGATQRAYDTNPKGTRIEISNK